MAEGRTRVCRERGWVESNEVQLEEVVSRTSRRRPLRLVLNFCLDAHATYRLSTPGDQTKRDQRVESATKERREGLLVASCFQVSSRRRLALLSLSSPLLHEGRRPQTLIHISSNPLAITILFGCFRSASPPLVCTLRFESSTSSSKPFPS